MASSTTGSFCRSADGHDLCMSLSRWLGVSFTNNTAVLDKNGPHRRIRTGSPLSSLSELDSPRHVVAHAALSSLQTMQRRGTVIAHTTVVFHQSNHAVNPHGTGGYRSVHITRQLQYRHNRRPQQYVKHSLSTQLGCVDYLTHSHFSTSSSVSFPRRMKLLYPTLLQKRIARIAVSYPLQRPYPLTRRLLDISHPWEYCLLALWVPPIL